MVKNLYTVNEDGLIVYKTERRQIGKKHDYRIYKKNHPDIPNKVAKVFDLGFLGVQKDFPAEQKWSPPFKRRETVG